MHCATGCGDAARSASSFGCTCVRPSALPCWTQCIDLRGSSNAHPKHSIALTWLHPSDSAGSALRQEPSCVDKCRTRRSLSLSSPGLLRRCLPGGVSSQGAHVVPGPERCASFARQDMYGGLSHSLSARACSGFVHCAQSESTSGRPHRVTRTQQLWQAVLTGHTH